MIYILAIFNNNNEFLYCLVSQTIIDNYIAIDNRYQTTAVNSIYWSQNDGVVIFDEVAFKLELKRQTLDRAYSHLDTVVNDIIGFRRDQTSPFFGGSFDSTGRNGTGGYGYKNGWLSVLNYSQCGIYQNEAKILISWRTRLFKAAGLVAQSVLDADLTDYIDETRITNLAHRALDEPQLTSNALLNLFNSEI